MEINEEDTHNQIPRMIIFLIECPMESESVEGIYTSIYSCQAKEVGGGVRSLNIKMIQTAQVKSQIEDGIKVLHSRNSTHS